MMRLGRLLSLVLLTASLGACAAKAQVRTEVELPLLDPPPPPPRVVATYPEELELQPVAVVTEAAAPARPPVRPARPDTNKPDPAPAASEVAAEATKPATTPSLTLTPSPGSEAQTAAAIRELMARATRDLSRVNAASLAADGRAQFDAARRFLQQAEDALKVRNVVYAGKLADKAATMAAVLVR